MSASHLFIAYLSTKWGKPRLSFCCGLETSNHLRSVCTTSICFQFSVWTRGICPCAFKKTKTKQDWADALPTRDKYRFYKSHPLLRLWALLRPGHGTIHLKWQPLFISPSYWNKWLACFTFSLFLQNFSCPFHLPLFLSSVSLFSTMHRHSHILHCSQFLSH